MSDEDGKEDTQVTRLRKPSDAYVRANSEVLPALAVASEAPPGPEQEAALGEAFGKAFDIITESSRELTLENARILGKLKNETQAKNLLQEQVDALKRENGELRELIRKIRGGR